MCINELVDEIIYFCDLFDIFELDNKNLITKEITKNLDNIVFVENLINRLHEEMKLKRYISIINKHRLDDLLAELEGTKISLLLDEALEKIN